MARTWQKGILFVAGVALGAAAGVVGVMALRDGGPSHALLATHAMGSGPAPAARAAAAASAVAEVVKLDAGECNLPPILPKKGGDDGQINLDAHPAVGSESEVASVLLTGKEAEASGRQHDAEVAFMNACRNAALVQGNPIPLADAMYQLARHYANSAAFGAQPQKELFDRAERLYSASLLAYQARLGTGNEKTKFAAEGLKTVQQVTGHSGPVTAVAKAAPAPAPTPVAQPAAKPAATPVPAPTPAAAPAPAPEVAKAPAQAPKPAPTEVGKADTARPEKQPEPAKPPVEHTAKATAPKPAPRHPRREESSEDRPAPAEAAPAESHADIHIDAEKSEPAVVAEPRHRSEPRRVAPAPAPAAVMGDRPDRGDEDAAPPPPPRRMRHAEPDAAPPADADSTPGTASGSVGDVQ